ncbi:MAG: flagellar assembly protein FliW [Desulfitobacteriaceae bacterium]
MAELLRELEYTDAVQVDEKTVFRFPIGIPGFESYHEFYLVEDEDLALAKLVAVKDENIGFILLKPYVFFSDYRTEFSGEDDFARVFQTKGDTLISIDVWVIVTLNSKDMTQTTVNLRAPILLDRSAKLGVQIILNDEAYAIKEPLIQVSK